MVTRGDAPDRPATSGAVPLRVGVVGCGRMGEAHLRVLSARPDVAVVAVCDPLPDRLVVAARIAPDVRRFAQHAHLYEQAAPDLVVVATPPTCRSSPVGDALARGIAVLSEKPLATDLAAADAMLAAATRTGALLAVHHQYRMSTALHRCRALIAAGGVGEVVLLRGRGKGGRPAGLELLEIGTHLADTMMALAGPPEWCSATVWEAHRLAGAGDVRRGADPGGPDFGPVVGTRIAATYGFPGGAIGEMHFLGSAARVPENYGVDVLGTTGQLALRCSRHVSSPLWYLPRPLEGEAGQRDDWQAVDVPGDGNRGLVEAFYRELLPAVREGVAVPCSGHDGAAALEMVLAAHWSHREGGRRVPLPLRVRDHPLATWER